jgi:hypothetical protein
MCICMAGSRSTADIRVTRCAGRRRMHLESRRQVRPQEVFDHRPQEECVCHTGQDIAHHGNDPARVIGNVRNFFNDHRARHAALPGAAALCADYERIRNDIGLRIAAEARLGKWDDLSFRDYVDVLTGSLKSSLKGGLNTGSDNYRHPLKAEQLPRVVFPGMRPRPRPSSLQTRSHRAQ